MLQFSSLNVDRVSGVYLMEYLPGIGQQLVQMIYISPAVNSTIIIHYMERLLLTAILGTLFWCPILQYHTLSLDDILLFGNPAPNKIVVL